MARLDVVIVLLVLCSTCHVSLAQSQVIYTFNLTYALTTNIEDAYEHPHFIAALAGIVNQQAPNLFVYYLDVDSAWLGYVSQTWLDGATYQPIATLEDLVSQFSNYVNGAVIYDPDVPATSNVASTAAGALDLLPICYRPVNGSLYSRFVTTGLLKPALSLVGKFNNNSTTKSAKNDAYLWAIDQFLLTGLSNASFMGYYVDYFWTKVSANFPIDANTVMNHDFFISRGAFFFDLDVWPTGIPNDDPTQPEGTDYHTLVAILEAANKMLNASTLIYIGGFPPWAFKYVNSQFPGVATEWQFAQLATSYNAYMDADACCVGGVANLQFFSLMPLSSRYVQNAAPTQQQLVTMGYLDAQTLRVVPRLYVMFYAGDWDSASWLNREFKGLWDDPARGKVPIAWAPDPNLSERFPPVFQYIYSSLTPNDFFVAGDSGAGYLNPTNLFAPRASGLPDATALWVARCQKFYRQFNLRFSGFVINGAAGDMTPEAEELYGQFSPDGMVEQWGYSQPVGGTHITTNNVPVFQEYDFVSSDTAANAAWINQNLTAQLLTNASLAAFLSLRGILRPASWYADIAAALNSQVTVVDPYTFAYLARVQNGASNDNRVSYTADTIPTLMTASANYTVMVTVRNEGWNNLTDTSVLVSWQNSAAAADTLSASTPLISGSSVNFTGIVFAPTAPGYYSLQYELIDSSQQTFSSYGNLPWVSTITVQ